MRINFCWNAEQWSWQYLLTLASQALVVLEDHNLAVDGFTTLKIELISPLNSKKKAFFVSGSTGFASTIGVHIMIYQSVTRRFLCWCLELMGPKRAGKTAALSAETRQPFGISISMNLFRGEPYSGCATRIFLPFLHLPLFPVLK